MSDDRAGRIYEQWCEDFRALQTVFWRVPFFAMTITGGLGAAVIAFDGATEIKRLLLVFAGICDFVLILIGWRIRQIMEVLLKKIYDYEGKKKPKTGFFVLKCFSALFAGVGVMFFSAAALFPARWLSPEQHPTERRSPEQLVPPQRSPEQLLPPQRSPEQPLPPHRSREQRPPQQPSTEQTNRQ
jgi:hypothetical protein